MLNQPDMKINKDDSSSSNLNIQSSLSQTTVTNTTKNPALEMMRKSIKFSLFSTPEMNKSEVILEQNHVENQEKINENGNGEYGIKTKDQNQKEDDNNTIAENNIPAGKNPYLERMRNRIKVSLFNQDQIRSNANENNLICDPRFSRTEESPNVSPLENLTFYDDNDSDDDGREGNSSIDSSFQSSLIMIMESTQDDDQKEQSSPNNTNNINNDDDDDTKDHEEKKSNLSPCSPNMDTKKRKLYRVSSLDRITKEKKIFYNYDKNMTPKQVLNEIEEEEDPDIHFLKEENEFENYYVMTEYLGAGTTGRVEKCYKISDNVAYAVKIVDYKGDMEILKMILKEFKNHKMLSHKNIVKVYELYVDTTRNTIYTILELAECKEMFDVIHELGSYSEAIASSIFKQIVTAIHYMHSQGVCHRDLKPNNILVSNDGTIVKITDFNVSKFIDNSKKRFKNITNELFKMWTYTGTVAFLAPEVFLDTEYTFAVDMWSAGVVLYTMLCGYQPFQAEYLQDLIELIKEGKYEFHPDPWDKISKEAKDLVKRCLTKDPFKRYDPWKALTHPWVSHHSKVPKSSIPDTVKNLKDHLRRNTRIASNEKKKLFRRSDLPNSLSRRDRASTQMGITPFKILLKSTDFANNLANHEDKSIEDHVESCKSNPLDYRTFEFIRTYTGIDETLAFDMDSYSNNNSRPMTPKKKE